jgi:hypothetical protein
MRVLCRIVLTLLVALPVVLGMAVFLAMQALEGGAASDGADAHSSDRLRLGQERTPT